MLNFQHDDSRIRTPAEVAAGVTPVNYAFPPGNVLRYGATGNGVTDDTAAIQAAAGAASFSSAAGKYVYLPAVSASYLVSAQITIPSGVTVYGDGAASIVKCSNNAISVFFVDAGTKAVFRDFKIFYTSASATSFIGGITLFQSDHCLVENMDFEAMAWTGVYLDSSSHCTICDNYIHGTIGTAQDSSDICIYRDSSYNFVSHNRCLGGTGAWHGILIQDPSGATLPLRNIIHKNHIGAHSTYGIINYLVTNANNGTLIDGNLIEDIAGTTLGGASGAGVYVLGAGDVRIVNNLVKNACASTSSDAGNPAGIAIAGANTAGILPCVVANNNVDMLKYYGIQVSGGPAVINGNFVQAAGTGTSYGIYVVDSSNVVVSSNTVILPSTLARQAIFVQAVNIDLTNVVITSNIVKGGNSSSIATTGVAGHTVTACITGNNVSGGGSGNVGLSMVSLLDSSVTGNYSTAATAAIVVSGCTGVRGSGNIFRSAGFTFSTGGTNSGVLFDQTNDFGTNVALISNGNAGINIEFRANATPSGGNWQVGDSTEQSVPVVGNPKRWRCTVAGAPGTWVSEGNL